MSTKQSSIMAGMGEQAKPSRKSKITGTHFIKDNPSIEKIKDL